MTFDEFEKSTRGEYLRHKITEVRDVILQDRKICVNALKELLDETDPYKTFESLVRENPKEMKILFGDMREIIEDLLAWMAEIVDEKSN